MKIHELTASPTGELARRLDDFEKQFRYPLGNDTWFRITHGPEYLRFYASIGEAVCYVAESEEQVVGTICVALTSAIQPDGLDEPIAYFGDLKVVPGPARGLTAARLLQAASRWALDRVSRAIAVVMEGTPVLPAAYTGRAEIPVMEPVARMAILRLPVSAAAASPSILVSDPLDVELTFRCLVRGEYALEVGTPVRRSQMPVVPLLARDRRACGVLEDTRRAKRLFVVDGDEMISAHLSAFAWESPADGARLLRDALARCREFEIPAMFVAVPAVRAAEILTALEMVRFEPAGATVYAHGFPTDSTWHLHTAEI